MGSPRSLWAAWSAGLLAAPGVAEGQLAARQVKIGVLCFGACFFGATEAERPLLDALERVGLVQGRTLTWDVGAITNAEDQIAVGARQLVSRHPDLILVWPGSVTVARAAKEATRTIPIVLMAASDAVEHGLVDSLRRPGGNITGTTVPLFDLTMKQIQILKEIIPRLKGVIGAHGELDPSERKTVDRLRGASASLGMEVVTLRVNDAKDLEHALSSAREGVSGVLVIESLPLMAQRHARELALERKLPLILPWRVYAGGAGSTGSLISYGPHFSNIAERTATLIDRILKGARPGGLPVEEPTRYELVIDGVMAKALGLTIPPSVRARADFVLD